MLNKVLIQGIVKSSAWGKKENSGFFVTIEQDKKVGGFTWKSRFNLYANRPLALELASIVEKNPNALITVEGELNVYYSQKTKDYKTTICVNKILPNDNPII